MSDTGYIVYIDEAGDFGLRNVAAEDRPGASEWLVMGAAVVRKRNETAVPQWLRAIRDEAKNTQPLDLHFRKLSDRQKLIVCEKTADLRMRLFVVISNKRNMEGHRNHAAQRVSKHKHWFYWWLSRLLLERVTGFCAETNIRERTPGQKLQIEFSRRKDMRRHEFTDYFTRLWAQRENAFLNKRCIDWSVFDFEKVHFYDHETRAGLQFADIVASSFYQAANTYPNVNCCSDYARLLMPRIHHPVGGSMLDEGFTVWPYSLAEANLGNEQKQIFRDYGYPSDRLG